MKAVILAAGLGTRMKDKGKILPKCLMEINGKSILENQIGFLNKCGIKDIYVVIGDQGDCWTKENKGKIKKINKNVIINLANTKTKNTYRLKLALDKIGYDDLVIFDGDMIFSFNLIKSVLDGNKDLIISKKTTLENDPSYKIIIDEDKKVMGITKDVQDSLIYGGFMKIKKESLDALKEIVNKKKYYALDLGSPLDELSKKISVFAHIRNNWVNVNIPENLEEAQRLLKNQFLVIMYGYTGVGKSTIAKKIAKIPNTEIFHSAIIRKELGLTPKTVEEAEKFFNYRNNLREEVDRKVYSDLAKNALDSLKEGKNVILDAAFYFEWQRNMVYEKIKEEIPEVFIVKITCKNEEEVRRRLIERKDKFNKSPLHETPSWDTYLVTKEITESLERDLKENNLLNILEYDTFSKELTLITKSENSDNIQNIIGAINY